MTTPDKRDQHTCDCGSAEAAEPHPWEAEAALPGEWEEVERDAQRWRDRAAEAAEPAPERTVKDDFGGEWLKCARPECGLQVVRPGKVQCWCDGKGGRLDEHPGSVSTTPAVPSEQRDPDLLAGDVVEAWTGDRHTRGRALRDFAELAVRALAPSMPDRAALPPDLDAMRTVALLVASAGGEVRIAAADLFREWQVEREADAYGSVTYRARLSGTATTPEETRDATR